MHHSTKKTISPYPSAYCLKCLLCCSIENKQQHTASCPCPICTGQKTTFPSVLTPTLCPVSQQRKLLLLLLLEGQCWTEVWEKVKEGTDKSLWGVFDSQNMSPVPGSWLKSPRELPAIPPLWTKQLHILTFHWLWSSELNPQWKEKKCQYLFKQRIISKECFWY